MLLGERPPKIEAKQALNEFWKSPGEGFSIERENIKKAKFKVKSTMEDRKRFRVFSPKTKTTLLDTGPLFRLAKNRHLPFRLQPFWTVPLRGGRLAAEPFSVSLVAHERLGTEGQEPRAEAAKG